jgi:hypothetical protein
MRLVNFADRRNDIGQKSGACASLLGPLENDFPFKTKRAGVLGPVAKQIPRGSGGGASFLVKELYVVLAQVKLYDQNISLPLSEGNIASKHPRTSLLNVSVGYR